ncbi:hypothetical protein EI427_04000 [Flammeovirga pectinis]|uniref:Uncharacterized protein n=1 Tax=Flammeovirga pectinis TaxID=2494373 RepID=A0A3Q9FJW0_9BACT|nr:hypothetical protein [Flammeovirga pectinis]AZQ61415.1 hypothetical protein EI427_04000 [Flammeovirga pectinis]
MEQDFLTLYDDFTLGVAAYKRLKHKTFIFCYLNEQGKKLDNFDVNNYGKVIHEVYPELEQFGLIDHLENVFQTGQQMILPFSAYSVYPNKTIYRANKIKKIGKDMIINIYNDESETYSYIKDIKKNNNKVNEALAILSHQIRGDVSTSLGLIELHKQELIEPHKLECSLDLVKKNLENIDFTIHDLVDVLFKKTTDE